MRLQCDEPTASFSFSIHYLLFAIYFLYRVRMLATARSLISSSAYLQEKPHAIPHSTLHLARDGANDLRVFFKLTSRTGSEPDGAAGVRDAGAVCGRGQSEGASLRRKPCAAASQRGGMGWRSRSGR